MGASQGQKRTIQWVSRALRVPGDRAGRRKSGCARQAGGAGGPRARRYHQPGAVRVLAVHELHATGLCLWSPPAVAVRSVSIRPMLSSALSRVRRAPRERRRWQRLLRRPMRVGAGRRGV